MVHHLRGRQEMGRLLDTLDVRSRRKFEERLRRAIQKTKKEHPGVSIEVIIEDGKLRFGIIWNNLATCGLSESQSEIQLSEELRYYFDARDNDFSLNTEVNEEIRRLWNSVEV
jgi:ABC-type molybdate transport system ATPase subunit